MPDKNPHKDHRKRLRKEFFENGITEATPDHKILEMLLFTAIPRKDTNELAHALLARFGSFAGVLNATKEQLQSVNGIGENAALLITLLLPTLRRYESKRGAKGPAYNKLDDICDYLMAKYMGFTTETFALTSFNSLNRIIAFDILRSGDATSVQLPIRAVLEKAIERKAVGVVISHNHPGGDAIPSLEDMEMTTRIRNSLAHINVELLDHVVLCDDDCVSMAQSIKFVHLFQD